MWLQLLFLMQFSAVKSKNSFSKHFKCGRQKQQNKRLSYICQNSFSRFLQILDKIAKIISQKGSRFENQFQLKITNWLYTIFVDKIIKMLKYCIYPSVYCKICLYYQITSFTWKYIICNVQKLILWR